ncbi:MAG: hypothetical protein C4519_13730 [Desulfobacteraceae bacterium]|nr:MAG: hypothetical protein C4519_13730 [Desulfobacteraceae bacterium]
MNTSAKIPGWLEPYFWDVRIEELDLKDNGVFIIERLLNEGDQKALNWLFGVYAEKISGGGY